MESPKLIAEQEAQTRSKGWNILRRRWGHTYGITKLGYIKYKKLYDMHVTEMSGFGGKISDRYIVN